MQTFSSKTDSRDNDDKGGQKQHEKVEACSSEMPEAYSSEMFLLPDEDATLNLPLQKEEAVEKPVAPEHEAAGTHLLLTLRGCRNIDLIEDVVGLKDLVRRAVSATGATIMQIVSQEFEPQGITVVAVLAESHASLHTYPESGIVFWDCFTCGTTCKPEASVNVLKAELQAREVNYQSVPRG